MDSLLEVNNISAGYGKLLVLHDVSLRVKKGDAVAILGPNGSGKSTLLKTIMGLTNIFEGEISFEGKRVTRVKAHRIARLGIGYVPQVDAVFEELTVQENIEMGAFIRKDLSITDDIEEVFELFPPLKGRKKKRAGTLSGGERRMLAVARGLMMRPSLLLLDEPTHSMAPNQVSLMFKKISEVNKEHGITVVIVEQNSMKALQNTNHAYILAQGKKIREDKSESLLNDPDIGRLYLGAG